MFPGQGKRPAPFIFTSEDLAAVITGCAVLRPAMRAAACTALFGLIAVTGIRIGEALAIPAGGIDLDAGLLPVMPAKSRCQRILPAAPHHRRRAQGLRRPPRPRLPRGRDVLRVREGNPAQPAARADILPEGLRRRRDHRSAPGSMTRGTASRLIPCWSGTGPVKTSPRRCRPYRDILAIRLPKGHIGIFRLSLS